MTNPFKGKVSPSHVSTGHYSGHLGFADLTVFSLSLETAPAFIYDRLHDLQGPMPSVSVKPIVQKLLRISRWQPQSIKPYTGPFWLWGQTHAALPWSQPCLLSFIESEQRPHPAVGLDHVTLVPNHPTSHCPTHTDGYRGEAREPNQSGEPGLVPRSSTPWCGPWNMQPPCRSQPSCDHQERWSENRTHAQQTAGLS